MSTKIYMKDSNFNCSKDVLNILLSAVKAPAKYLQEVAIRKAKEWTNELIISTKYIGVLRKKFEKSLIEMTHLNMKQKNGSIQCGIESKIKPPKTMSELLGRNSSSSK